MAGVFRHLDHGPIARCERIDQTGEAKVDRKVPGHDGPNNTQRLGHYPVAGAKKITQIDTAALRFHPFLEVFEYVVDTVNHRENFGKQGLMAGAIAVIGIDRFDHALLVVPDKSLQLEQIGATFAIAGHGVCKVGGALEIEGGIEFVANHVRCACAEWVAGVHEAAFSRLNWAVQVSMAVLPCRHKAFRERNPECDLQLSRI